MYAVEELDVAIAGGGICGLATALALHRKGIRSVVLERSETLRATGAGIGILTNGWRALDELGVGSKLRQITPFSLQRKRDIDLVTGAERPQPLSVGEACCMRRSDLLQALADDLPHGTIRFGCNIVSVNLDATTSFPVLHLSDGNSIRAKVLVGCDGAYSVVGNYLGLSPPEVFSLRAVRGFTSYPDGHGFAPEFTRMKKGNILHGRSPVDNNLLYWFVLWKSSPKDSKICKDQEEMKQLALEAIKDYPIERIEMVESCDVTSLSVTHLRYRAPWYILQGKYRKGTVTVAGDAMHVMGPFIGQGGSAAIEDAVVLARCLAPTLQKFAEETFGEQIMVQKIGEAIDEYVKERRMRLFWITTQTYLIGSLLENPSKFVKILIAVILLVLFGNPMYHTRYDCGRL